MAASDGVTGEGVTGDGILERTGRAVRRTPAVLAGAVRRRDAVFVFSLVTLSYVLVYLWAIQDLVVGTGLGVGIDVVSDPLARAFESGPGQFTYEGVAIVDLWVVRLLFSPVNVSIGVGLAALVGANLALSYLAVVQPRSCGISASSGVLASLPALLSGGACCAPVLLIALGITAGGTLLTAITWLLPVGVALLLASLVYLAAQISPTAFGE